MGLSHPHFVLAKKFFNQGNVSIYNSMVHELFHHVYWDAWLWQIEPPLENPALREFIRSLQNEGMAVNATSRIWETYPSSLDFDYLLINFQPYVRYWISRVNQVFENPESKTVEKWWQDVVQIPSHGKYIVGGYMAERIEDQLGRDALVATVANGPMSFIRTYNTVAEESLRIRLVEPRIEAGDEYYDLRASALEGNLPMVRDILQDIRSGQTVLSDFESEGHLLYTSGYILLRNEDLKVAEETFQTLISLDPQVAAGYIGLGDVYTQQGEISRAVENYERAMELDPRFLWLEVIIQQLEAKN
jgi:tetratricopeptide (TPR) repeat protein